MGRRCPWRKCGRGGGAERRRRRRSRIHRRRHWGRRVVNFLSLGTWVRFPRVIIIGVVIVEDAVVITITIIVIMLID